VKFHAVGYLYRLEMLVGLKNLKDIYHAVKLMFYRMNISFRKVKEVDYESKLS